MDNEPAFPLKTKRNNSTDPLATPREVEFLGLTMRDWFAGQALTGIIMTCAGDTRAREVGVAPYFAEQAYQIADAMMEARND